ncbi:hypothetical protein BE11_15280 [Sorangium cellulosum]|nr:hypothetical protein BE11_15280 [Sorangium cellulosum]
MEKLNAWLDLVPSKGPFAAVDGVYGLSCKKLQSSSGQQWQLKLGIYHRVSFTVTEFHQVELLSVGHT